MHVDSVWILHLLLGLACFSRHLVGKREVCIIMVGLDRASCFMGAISRVSEHLCLDITNLPFAGFSRQNNDPVDAWDLLNTLDMNMRFCMISRHQGIGWSWEYRWERCRPWVSMWRSWTDFSCRSLLRLDFELSWIELLELSSQAKEYKNIVFTVWDLGGQTRTRQIWQHYYQLLGSQFCNILHSEIESYEQVQHHVWVVYGCLGHLCRAKEHRWAHLRLALSNGTPMPAMLPYPLMHVTDAQKSEVIDSSDRDRIDEAHEELMKMLQKDEMKDWRYLGCIGETTIEVNFAWTEFLVCQGKWMLQGGSKEQFLCRMQCCLWWQISKTSRMLWVLRWGQKIYSRELGKAILAVILLNCPVKKLRSWCKSWAWTAWVSTEGNGSCRRAFHPFSATGHTVFNWLPGIHDSKIWPLHPQSCPQETCATVGDGLHEARKLWEAQNGGEMKCAWIDLYWQGLDWLAQAIADKGWCTSKTADGAFSFGRFKPFSSLPLSTYQTLIKIFMMPFHLGSILACAQKHVSPVSSCLTNRAGKRCCRS